MLGRIADIPTLGQQGGQHRLHIKRSGRRSSYQQIYGDGFDAPNLIGVTRSTISPSPGNNNIFTFI